MTRLLLGLLASLTAVPVAVAQAPTEAVPAVDSALALYLGVWQIGVADTPMGAVGGTLTVAVDGTGTLSLAEMKVAWAPVVNIHVVDSAFVGSTSFSSPVSGMTHTGVITLAPAGDGTLTGTIADSLETYVMTAQRPAP